MDQKLKDFDLLLLDYKEGTISDADLQKLQKMLKENEVLRGHYIREQALDAMLNIEEEISLPKEITSESKKPVEGNFSVLYTVAAALIIALGVAALLPKDSQSNPVILNLEEVGDELQIIREGKKLVLDDIEGIIVGDKIITSKKVPHLAM